VLQPVDAELLVFRRQRRSVGAGERHIRREIHALCQLLGELKAHPGRCRVRIDGVVHQAETVFVAHLLILGAHVGDLALIERQAERIQRRAPQSAFSKRPADHGERIGLVLRVGRALIGDIGRGRGALHEEGLFARGRRSDLEDGAGKAEPIAAVFRRGRGDLTQDLQARAEIVALEGGICIRTQRRRRFRHRPRLALDLGLQLDCGIGEVVPLEGLVGGKSGHEAEQKHGANRRGASQTVHDGTPDRGGRPRAAKDMRNGDGLMAAKQA
jgi:hypothetical protein